MFEVVWDHRGRGDPFGWRTGRAPQRKGHFAASGCGSGVCSQKGVPSGGSGAHQHEGVEHRACLGNDWKVGCR